MHPAAGARVAAETDLHSTVAGARLRQAKMQGSLVHTSTTGPLLRVGGRIDPSRSFSMRMRFTQVQAMRISSRAALAAL